MNTITTTNEWHCLCVNAGSSSLKLALYRIGADGTEQRVRSASAREIGRPEAAIDVDGQIRPKTLPDHQIALETLFASWDSVRVDAVGHRVVHGGEHTRPERITPELLKALSALTPLAPLHNPPALAGIRAVEAHLPDTPQVACFDTAFHATLPDVARTLPLAHRFREHGIRRYGFHGLSYEYIARKLGAQAKGRIVIAHLGNGASLAALRDGRSIDTTMGLTPTGGIPMGTRCGDLDPGVLLHLLREEGLNVDELAHTIDHESGLIGLSGETSDMAELLASDTPDARLAVALFAYQVKKTIGAYAAALGGLDQLVFTGGIGEHAAAVRAMVCRDLAYLGIELDAAANEADKPSISTPQSACAVHVTPTDEDAMIARHAYELLETCHDD